MDSGSDVMKPIDFPSFVPSISHDSIRREKGLQTDGQSPFPSVDTCARLRICMCGSGLFIVVEWDYVCKRIEKSSVNQPTVYIHEPDFCKISFTVQSMWGDRPPPVLCHSPFFFPFFFFFCFLFVPLSTHSSHSGAVWMRPKEMEVAKNWELRDLLRSLQEPCHHHKSSQSSSETANCTRRRLTLWTWIMQGRGGEGPGIWRQRKLKGKKFSSVINFRLKPPTAPQFQTKCVGPNSDSTVETSQIENLIRHGYSKRIFPFHFNWDELDALLFLPSPVRLFKHSKFQKDRQNRHQVCSENRYKGGIMQIR